MTEQHHPASFARTTVMKHNQGVLIIAVVVVLFQCSQSALYHLDLKHHQKIEYLSKKYHAFFINQDDAAGGADVVNQRKTLDELADRTLEVILKLIHLSYLQTLTTLLRQFM